MALETDRLSLPLLAVAQAQKEVTHNEALTLLDAAVQAVVVAVAPSMVPSTPALGACWIVGTAAAGAWSGHDGALAVWTSGGWRFVGPVEGMAAWSLADSMPVRRQANAWIVGATHGRVLHHDGVQVVGARSAAISSPSGGAVIDAQARAAVELMLAALRTHGLITT